VAPAPLTARPFRPRRGLTVLGAIAVYGLGLSALYAATGRGLPCPFRMVTGWQCPLCGGTRLGSALLRGDMGAAFADNPVVLISLVVVSLLGGLWTIEALGGPAVRPPARVADALRRVRPNAWVVIGLLLAGLDVVLRHLF
jgi:hypothetical protein